MDFIYDVFFFPGLEYLFRRHNILYLSKNGVNLLGSIFSFELRLKEMLVEPHIPMEKKILMIPQVLSATLSIKSTFAIEPMCLPDNSDSLRTLMLQFFLKKKN